MYGNRNIKAKTPKSQKSHKPTCKTNCKSCCNPKKTFVYKTCRHLFRREKRKFIIFLAIFVFCVILLIIMIILQCLYDHSENFGIVIDAGSTATRARLYKWYDGKANINDEATAVGSCETDTIQNLYFQNKNENLLKCIRTLFESIRYIRFKPPIYLAATAGMRIIELENKTVTKIMFKELRSLFYVMGWNFKFVGILKGPDEAVAGWVAVNFLQNTIATNSTIRKDNFITYGALDLGGSSTQIAFERKGGGPLVIFGKKYLLYSRSYLCHGTDMFKIRYLSAILVDPRFGEVKCFLKGTPRSMIKDSYTCRADSAKGADLSSFSKYFAANAVGCREQIRFALGNNVDVIEVDKNMPFVAVSTFAYYHDFLLKYFRVTGKYNSFVQATGLFCTEDFNTLDTKYGKDAKYARNYCLVGNLIIVLLEMYGLNYTNFDNIVFTNKIRGQDAGWPLGYMIKQTKDVPNSIAFKLNIIAFVIIVVICCLYIILAICIFLFKMWERHKKIHNIRV